MNGYFLNILIFSYFNCNLLGCWCYREFRIFYWFLHQS
ncbi:hypothetical protein SPWS13_3790 [Shewanella putrefaciens]|nr:hypothetical protein SPWS13_3790 [Shewanella putrefaciens]